ncbi:MAG: hypothetical protein D6677_13090 [Calditrichaeota bacterium]|nr:MAG: hypothetical protein D6677_13090 [Calditrichota bacterium]
MKDGLPDNMIYAALEDEQGNIWISTNRGIVRLNPADRSIRLFDVRDGLLNMEYNVSAFFRGRNGQLFFGGNNGLDVVYPDRLTGNPIPPPVALTGFRLFNKPVKPGPDGPLRKTIDHADAIQLRYDQRVFSFEFAALDFTAPEKNRYAYLLEGFDETWIDAGNQRMATYTNLDPGAYIFRVKAANNSGLWNEQGASIRVTIQPPFWMSWWFRLIVLGIIGGLVYLFYRMRLERALAVERTRTRIARDLHDDLSANLSSITYFIEAIRGDSKKKMSDQAQKFLNLISESAMESQEKIQDIIWAINTGNDSWEQLLVKMRRYASDMLDSRGMDYTLEIPGQITAPPLSMEQRRNFWLIYKEVITNITRHAQARHAHISLTVAGKSIRLTIQDDGIGFDPQLASQRNGLKNIKTRIKEMGGDYEVNAAPGEGTRWRIGLKYG